MARRAQRKMLSQTLQAASIEGLSHEGRGIAHVAGKTVFIEGALPGEEVLFRYTRRRSKFDEGCVAKVLQAASTRVEPGCRHFGLCGGCSLQHMSTEAQLQLKQETLRQQLYHFGGVEPGHWLLPARGSPWGYRRKARLGVKFVKKKHRVLVGFREKSSCFIAELERCEVLHPSVGGLLPQLAELIGALRGYNQIPQLEVAVGDRATGLVFRHLAPLTAADKERLISFGQMYNLQIYLQPGGAETVHLLWPEKAPLSYSQFGSLEMRFLPAHFIQVNGEMNAGMVRRALELLRVDPRDRVLDLFCGIGNFTLPLASAGAEVLGVEGDEALIAQARANAKHNGLKNIRFEGADLESLNLIHCAWARGGFSKVLLDPPRSGAFTAIRQMSQLNVQRIVYISCNSATLARDADELVNRQGYRLHSVGVMDMFPHTTHMEAIALFEQADPKLL